MAMKTPASIAGHPIHPMLVAIPIGLWIFSLLSDLVRVFGAAGDNWRILALYTLAGGIAGALLAAIPGLIDLLSLPAPVKRTALIHMTINLAVVALYAVNLWLRLRGAEEATVVWLSVIGIGFLVISGWLGGKMVYEHGVGVGT
jgi:uncharacterized membrane protein